MLSASRNDQRHNLCVSHPDNLESATYRIFRISIPNDKGKIFKFLIESADCRYSKFCSGRAKWLKLFLY